MRLNLNSDAETRARAWPDALDGAGFRPRRKLVPVTRPWGVGEGGQQRRIPGFSSGKRASERMCAGGGVHCPAPLKLGGECASAT